MCDAGWAATHHVVDPREFGDAQAQSYLHQRDGDANTAPRNEADRAT